MKVFDFYSPFIKHLTETKDVDQAIRIANDISQIPDDGDPWNISKNKKDWMLSQSYQDGLRQSAESFAKKFPDILRKVEEAFQSTLIGQVHLIPSLGSWDGFARYDSGTHIVYLGVDHPDSNLDYMTALSAHELSHVFRDHQPAVWAHLGKPLKEISRSEYLNGQTAEEHLASEGLATLFSQTLYPEIHPMHHHYYSIDEWNWCVQNHQRIHEEITKCLMTEDKEIWSFYSEGRVHRDSPSRTHYYWASNVIRKSLTEPDLHKVVEMHKKNAFDFECFSISSI